MQISIRSHLIAGTAAVVGATAIAVTPVTAANISLPAVNLPSAAQVTLAGFDSPISELLGTVILGTNYIFNETSNPLALNDPLTGGPTWTSAGFTGVLPFALGNDALGGYSSVGLLPQIIDDALPVISRLGYNGSYYLQAALTGFAGAGYLLSEGVWNAIGDLLTLDIGGAINTLVTSVSNAGSLALSAGVVVFSNVLTKAAAVAQFLVEEIPTLIGATVGQVVQIGTAVVKPIVNAVTALIGLNLEGAWNALVDGYLGVEGLPGTILNLTLGAGIQTGPIAGPADIPANFVPSVRTVVQGAVKGLAGALATPVSPAAAVRPGAALKAAAVEAPAVTASDVQAEVSTPAEAPAETAPATAAGDSGSTATAGDSAPAPKAAVKHRVSRKAAG